MNNKGQVLPIFVILFPVIILFVSYIVDIGLMYTEKRKIENIIKDAIVYYIENKNNDNVYDKTTEFINRNISNPDIKIDIYEDYLTIGISKKHKSIYNIININTEIKVKYTGYYIDKRIVKG